MLASDHLTAKILLWRVAGLVFSFRRFWFYQTAIPNQGLFMFLKVFLTLKLEQCILLP